MGFGGGGSNFSPSPNNIQGDATITGNATIDGSLGIKTDNPAYDLHVSGSDSSGSAAVGVAFMGYSDNSTKAPGDATWAHINHTRDNGTVNQMDFALQQRSNGATIVNSPQGGNVSLRIGGYTGLQLDQKSNVGINTEPTARLHINAVGGGATLENDLLRCDGSGLPYVFYVEGTGLIGILTDTPTKALDINSDSMRLRTAKVPATAGAAGEQGEIAWGTDGGTSYLYVCIATNTWQRVALSTW